jgi:hypothetical protein
MKKNWLATGAVIGIVLVLALRFLIHHGAAPAESPADELARFRRDAHTDLLAQCTNQIVGLSRIIKMEFDDSDKQPSNWTAVASAEFVNRIGGVERTNLPFVFEKRSSPAGGQTYVLCIPDYKRIYGASK